MEMNLNLPQAIGLVVTLAGSILGGFWWLARIVVAQQRLLLDAQLQALAAQIRSQTDLHGAKLREVEVRLAQECDATQKLQNELHQLRNDLPTRFVMREDFVRFSSIVEAKVDRIHEKLDDLRRDIHARSTP